MKTLNLDAKGVHLTWPPVDNTAYGIPTRGQTFEDGDRVLVTLRDHTAEMVVHGHYGPSTAYFHTADAYAAYERRRTRTNGA